MRWREQFILVRSLYRCEKALGILATLPPSQETDELRKRVRCCYGLSFALLHGRHEEAQTWAWMLKKFLNETTEPTIEARGSQERVLDAVAEGEGIDLDALAESARWN